MEKVLVSNWTSFFNHARLLAVILSYAKNHELHMSSAMPSPGQTRIAVTRMEPQAEGFIVWVDFAIPKDGKMAYGTAEFVLSMDGEMRLSSVV